MSGMALFVEARTLFSCGDLAAAEASLHKLQASCQESDLPIWLTSPLAAWWARLRIAQGRLSDAARLLQDEGIGVEDETVLVRIDEYLSLARLLIARAAQDADLADALRLLGRLRAATEQWHIVGKTIEIAVLQALAGQKCGDVQQALSSLGDALSMASPEGYVQAFIDEGPPMAELLYQAVGRGLSPRFARRLLATFELDREPTSSPSPEQPLPEWLDPLSEREREVLDLVAQGLTNREIARALSLSISTVKVHTHHIYGKLDVHSRTQAVAKARALGVLPSLR
jgi:LuxR family maltose regulon positive regulatory protein